MSYVRTAGRYGVGLYASAASSKAHEYAAGLTSALGGRTVQSQPALQAQSTTCLMMVYVACGKGYKETSGKWQPTEPAGSQIITAPPGYDSVLGEVGGQLNYDEVVVYNDQAILPKFLIYYKT
jgi:hypothetical protein